MSQWAGDYAQGNTKQKETDPIKKDEASQKSAQDDMQKQWTASYEHYYKDFMSQQKNMLMKSFEEYEDCANPLKDKGIDLSIDSMNGMATGCNDFYKPTTPFISENTYIDGKSLSESFQGVEEWLDYTKK